VVRREHREAHVDDSDTITIRANASGRLWHENPDRWREICTPEGCPWCQGPGPPTDEILAETPTCWVTGGIEASLPGYVCVSTKAHAVEPYELDDETMHLFWDDAMTVARGLAAAVHPVKMNYEIHGNTIPHVHMHLFPRTPQDPYVGFVIHGRVQVTRTPEQLAEMTTGIRDALVAAGRLV
jgi:diadenosine tetraphosphate (Ap4A) HIT family hydrolase